jgi:hypothetical protein
MFDSALILGRALIREQRFSCLSDDAPYTWRSKPCPFSGDELIAQRAADEIAGNERPGSGTTAPGLKTYFEVDSVDGCEDRACLLVLDREIPKLVEVRADALIRNPEAQVAEAEEAGRDARNP